LARLPRTVASKTSTSHYEFFFVVVETSGFSFLRN
jgi:hypothetical protein